jgi:hypothetical protein
MAQLFDRFVHRIFLLVATAPGLCYIRTTPEQFGFRTAADVLAKVSGRPSDFSFQKPVKDDLQKRTGLTDTSHAGISQPAKQVFQKKEL